MRAISTTAGKRGESAYRRRTGRNFDQLLRTPDRRISPRHDETTRRRHSRSLSRCIFHCAPTTGTVGERVRGNVRWGALRPVDYTPLTDGRPAGLIGVRPCPRVEIPQTSKYFISARVIDTGPDSPIFADSRPGFLPRLIVTRRRRHAAALRARCFHSR